MSTSDGGGSEEQSPRGSHWRLDMMAPTAADRCTFEFGSPPTIGPSDHRTSPRASGASRFSFLQQRTLPSAVCCLPSPSPLSSRHTSTCSLRNEAPYRVDSHNPRYSASTHHLIILHELGHEDPHQLPPRCTLTPPHTTVRLHPLDDIHLPALQRRDRTPTSLHRHFITACTCPCYRLLPVIRVSPQP